MHRQPPPPHHTHTTHGTGERAQTESESIVPLKKYSFRFLLSTPTDLASREMMGPAPDEDWGWGIWPDLTFDTPTWKISGTQVIRPNWKWVLTVVYTILSRDFYATRLSVLCQIGCDVMMKKILWKWLVGCIQCTVPIIRAYAQHFLDLINQPRVWYLPVQTVVCTHYSGAG